MCRKLNGIAYLLVLNIITKLAIESTYFTKTKRVNEIESYHLCRGGVHRGHLRVDALLAGVLLRLLPADGGRIVAQRRKFRLLRQHALGTVDRLLPVAYG